VEVVIFSCKAILVDLCARPANYDWARLVPLAPQVDVRAQHMSILGAEKPREGDLVNTWLRNSEDARIDVHARIFNAAALVGELCLPHMLLGLMAGEGWRVAYGLQLVPHQVKLFLGFLSDLLQGLAYDFIGFSPTITFNFGTRRCAWDRDKERGGGIVVLGEIQRPSSARCRSRLQ